MVTQELERANQMDGIINVKKEAGMTSHDVVFKLRKILGTKEDRPWGNAGSRCGGSASDCSWKGDPDGRIHAR